MILYESILDNLEKDTSRVRPVSAYVPRPGESDFCLMVADINNDQERVIRNILDAFADDYHITYSRECPNIDDVMDGGRLGSISDYDCAIIEFSTSSLLNSVKALFYLVSRTYWMPAFICSNNKWTFVQENEDACTYAEFLFKNGRLKLDDWADLKNDIYGLIWPEETFDIDHANTLDKAMDVIRRKCTRVHSNKR